MTSYVCFVPSCWALRCFFWAFWSTSTMLQWDGVAHHLNCRSYWLLLRMIIKYQNDLLMLEGIYLKKQSFDFIYPRPSSSDISEMFYTYLWQQTYAVFLLPVLWAEFQNFCYCSLTLLWKVRYITDAMCKAKLSLCSTFLYIVFNIHFVGLILYHLYKKN